MILRETLRGIARLQAAELAKFPFGTKREVLGGIDVKLPFAIVISGVRRCGKSTLLHQLMERGEGGHYFNFEDSRTAGFELADFERLEEIFAEGFPVSDTYFFDEIQNVDRWELFVRSGLDRRRHFAISGSNASLLSAELGTRLTGRHLRVELFPFSYSEYLSFGRQKAGEGSFGEYMHNGGFPEYLQTRRVDALQELLQDILLRDIAVRHKIRSVKQLKEVAVFLISNLGKDFSYNSLAKTFSLGSANTAMDWMGFFEDSYLLFSLPKFDYSLKKQAVNARKVYCVDNGLALANSASFGADSGRLLENAAFMHLRRQFGAGNLFYFRGKNECDFLVREKNKINKAVQVCFEIHGENREREVGGLLEAMKEVGLEEGMIVTLNQEDRLKVDGKTVSIVPAWKWMQGRT